MSWKGHLVLGGLRYINGQLADAADIDSVGIRFAKANCANMPIVDSNMYYLMSMVSNVANEYFTLAFKLSGTDAGGVWFAFIRTGATSVSWTRI